MKKSSNRDIRTMLSVRVKPGEEDRCQVFRDLTQKKTDRLLRAERQKRDLLERLSKREELRLVEQQEKEKLEELRVERKRIGAEKRKTLLHVLSERRAKAVKRQEEVMRVELEKASARERRLDLAAMQRVKLLEELHRMDWEMTELLEEGTGRRRECGDRNWDLMMGNKWGGRKRFARKTGRWSAIARIWAGRKGIPRRNGGLLGGGSSWF